MATLDAIRSGGPPLAFADLGRPDPIVSEVQERLGSAGLLDPPADGQFGPVSSWALRAFRERVGHRGERLDGALAAALLEADADRLFPLRGGDDLAARIVAALRAKGFWFCRHPEARTIVYVERCDGDGRLLPSRPNAWCDRRIVLGIDSSGHAMIHGSWVATTAPGRPWVEAPMNPRGAARIVPGQYKAWSRGLHNGDHDALRQVSRILVSRDLNKDFDRVGDAVEPLDSTLNQHWGYDLVAAIDRASAGCLVGRSRSGHRAFMALVTADPRYVAGQRYRFMTTVLDHADLPGA